MAEKLPKKLQDWYLLTFSEFIKELTKQKVKLSLSEESEWEEFFTQESKKVLELKSSIDKTLSTTTAASWSMTSKM